ncbi:MAG TPA: TIGR03620 family F420-dependent LLM class oxidoreductase [Solirubrobacteraceae bacterium]|jgi:probable F420-dependent oxidoreductase|nr:TIGR03620 family F420-dependent LLM class oxidoreductase [Solirubrobacteraceae bacterium]
MEFGEFGIWTSFRAIGEENASEAASLVEELGFSALWLGGSPRLPSVRPLLAASDQLTVATGIVNVWANEPAELAAEHAALVGDFPGRLLVGIGIGHPEATSDYSRPLSTMRSFLDGLDGADPPLPREERVLAALRPKMLSLAAERTAGAHPYFVPVEHTQVARSVLGDGPLLATEMACVVNPDPVRGAEAARQYAASYLSMSNYTSNLLSLGFTEHDFADGGSDRLIDAIVPHGTAEEIVPLALAHLEAGADHVCLQPVGVKGVPREEWRALARALGL